MICITWKKIALLMVLVSVLMVFGCAQSLSQFQPQPQPQYQTTEFRDDGFIAHCPTLEPADELPAGVLFRAGKEPTYEISVDNLNGSFAETVNRDIEEFAFLGDAEIIGSKVGDKEASVEYSIDFGGGQVLHVMEHGILCNGRIYWVSISAFEPGFDSKIAGLSSYLESARCVE